MCVEVVEQLGAILWSFWVTAQALVEDCAAGICQGVVFTDGEAFSEKCVDLKGLVELELGVGDNVTSSAQLVCKDTTFERNDRFGSTDGSDVLLSL